jgi:expansin (peptidoglycan-binding protein)
MSRINLIRLAAPGLLLLTVVAYVSATTAGLVGGSAPAAGFDAGGGTAVAVGQATVAGTAGGADGAAPRDNRVTITAIGDAEADLGSL